ncbi:hypothetical protein [Mucilaginibacter sp. SP1R1]|uniref:hypothetical protein n=1 Tax=Mucilaginibacter sp. SP1R1 TaxID=2723091 RepID=UPI0016162309|nr:hypothetical protein [Mucilaginibacter sp. SP1R1]MBB6150581.1 hypothetical protein [Mucilaginibacter sp. SP1R1]
MHYSITFPIVDLRPILPETNKLKKPSWPILKLDVKSPFIRNFGCVKDRLKGGSEFWGSEDKFCDARGVMQFAKLSSGTKPIYRRFFSDGLFMNKLEIGLEHKEYYNVLTDTTVFDLEEVLKNLSQLKVNFKNKNNSVPVSLFESGKNIAACYADASTSAKLRNKYIYNNLVSGSPLSLVVYDKNTSVKLPANAKMVLSEIESIKHIESVTLHSIMLPIGNQRLKMWLLGIPNLGKKLNNSDQTLWDKTLRDLRINLSRIHIEKETTAVILTNINTRSIRFKKQSEEANRIEFYLKKVSKKILKKERFNLDQNNLLDFALKCDIDVYAGENQTLEELLDFIEDTYLKNDLKQIFPQ